jgi:hypothetical protein
MSKTRTSALAIASASALAWAVACSSAGKAAHETPAGVQEAGVPVPPRGDGGMDPEAGHGYTRLDDMEGTAVPWTGVAATHASWGTHTDVGLENDVSPVPGSLWSYAPVPTPYETFPGITSTHAARLRTVVPLAGTYGATMDFAFTVPDGAGPEQRTALLLPADLGKYKGITFWARAAQDPDTATLLVELQDKNTFAAGGVCLDSDGGTDHCFDGFGVTLSLTDTFTQYTIDFSALAQEGWGFRPMPDVPDLQNEYILFFQMNTPSGAPSLTFDLWIDDLYFINK